MPTSYMLSTISITSKPNRHWLPDSFYIIGAVKNAFLLLVSCTVEVLMQTFEKVYEELLCILLAVK